MIALSHTSTILYHISVDGSIVEDLEQEEKKVSLRRRANYLSRSVENLRTPLPGFAIFPPVLEQPLTKHAAVLEHSLEDLKRVVRRKLGLSDNLGVQLTQIRGNSFIVLEDGNQSQNLLRSP